VVGLPTGLGGLPSRPRFLKEGDRGSLFFPTHQLLQRLTEGGEPLDVPSQLGQFVEGGLGPTAPIEQRIHLFYDQTQHTSLGHPTADAPQDLPFGFVHVTLDEQVPRGEQRGALRFEPFFRAGRLLGC
jgi:hypothetical protein